MTPLGQMIEAEGPGEILSVDVTGPYTTSREGYRYLLTCIDHFTKWPEAIPLRDQEASTIAWALVNKVFSKHGVYKVVLSDRGRNFMSEIIREICALLGVKKVFTSPYHPEGNGQIENFHRVLNNGLACEINGQRDDWEKYVDLVLWAYRAQPHSTIGYSPFYMTHGRDMTGPGDKELSAYLGNKHEPTEAKEFVDKLASRLRKIHKEVRRKIKDGRNVQRQYHDRGTKRIEYKPGDLVYWRKMKKGKKLSEKWLGPYRVLEKLTNEVYQIKGPKGRLMNLNIGQLKRCKTTSEHIRDQRVRERKSRMDISTRGITSDSDTDEELDFEWVREHRGNQTIHPRHDETSEDEYKQDDNEISNSREGTRDRYNLRPRRHINYRE